MAPDGPPAGDTRAQIMTGVRSALAKHGYADLTTQKVAAETTVSEAGLFYHYDSKDELIAAFVDACADGLSERFTDLPSDPVERLYAVCDVLLAVDGGDETRGLNVAFMELLSHAPYNETLEEPLRDYEQFVLDEVADVVRAGVDAGVFEPVDPEATAAYIVATCDGTTGFGIALEMDTPAEAVRERLFDYLDTVVVAD